jgi:hypothetical protein
MTPGRSTMAGATSRRPRRWRTTALAVAVAAVIALLAWPRLQPQPTAPPAPPQPPVAAVVADSDGITRGSARHVAGVAVGWSRSQQDAVGAAAAYALVLSADWFLSDQQRRHQALAAMAAPEALMGLQAAQDEVAAGVARGSYGVGRARRGVRSVLRSSLLGYQVVRYDPSHAQVAMWAVVIYGNDGGLAPQALYATSTLRLRWVGDWKLLEVATVPGPVPIQGQATPSPAGELVEAADRFEEFGYAPA